MENLFSKRCFAAMGLHALVFTGMLLLYTTAVYFGLVSCGRFSGMLCVGVASLAAGIYAAAGQREKVLRACIAVAVPLLLWVIIAILAELKEPLNTGWLIKTTGVGIACAIVSAMICPYKKISNGKRRKHNSGHRMKTYS